MRIRVGCEMTYQFGQDTPMIVMLNVHASRVSDLEQPDYVITTPSVPLEGYRDTFGNWCNRLVAPSGPFSLKTDTVVRDSGQPDPADVGAGQHPVQNLPADTVLFLLGSRYCETDRLADETWRLFGTTPPGWARVQAICDFVHNHITFGHEHSRATRTATETYAEQRGVCRDYAHLALALRLAAAAVGRTATALGAFYRRLSARIGKAKAVTATARKIAVLFYNMLRHGMNYADPGASSYEERYRQRVLSNLRRRAKSLGYILQKADPAPTAMAVS